MAEGGADGPENPWVDDNLGAHDSDDETEVSRGDTTQPFQPGGSSTPYHGGEEIEMRTRLHEEGGMPETSYVETIFGEIHLRGLFMKMTKRLWSKEQKIL